MSSVTTPPTLEPTILLERDVMEVECRPFASGTVAMYSARSPAKSSANEDAAAAIPYGRQAGVLVVADGVGGERTGARAARVAIEQLGAALADGVSHGLKLRAAVLNGVDQANHAVTALGTGAATTLAIVHIDGRAIRPYHVGDSLILVVGQRAKIKHQTVAHGPVGYAVEAGLLGEAEAMHHEERHVVSNVVGSSEMRIEIGPRRRLAPRDTVVVASDGLSDNLYVDEIVQTVRTGRLIEAGRRLAEIGRRRMSEPVPGQPSKPDDLTFLVYRPR